MRPFPFAVIIPIVLPIGCASNRPLRTVEHVDLNRYLGSWYEVGRYPNRFERDCTNGSSTAEYIARPDGRITVINRCITDTGKPKESRGVARVVDRTTNARLAVTFQWPFEGKYWIIDLDLDYQWSVVGEPSREYLWILSRTPTMEKQTYDAILSRLPESGYDPARLMPQGIFAASKMQAGH